MARRSSHPALSALAIAALLLAVAAATVAPVQAGDINDPDLSDGVGDAVSNKDSRDLVSGLSVLKGVQSQEVDTCKDKAPAATPDAWPQAPPGSDLPTARLVLSEEDGTR